jgi:hypothetical protein
LKPKRKLSAGVVGRENAVGRGAPVVVVSALIAGRPIVGRTPCGDGGQLALEVVALAT